MTVRISVAYKTNIKIRESVSPLRLWKRPPVTLHMEQARPFFPDKERDSCLACLRKITLSYHIQNDSISIAIGHHPSKGTPSRHAETARVVDDDEIRATLFDEFGRQSDAWIFGYL